MEISVILPIHNAASTLKPCLEALRREFPLGAGCEILCVDNGSTDRSVEIVHSFPAVVLLREPKRGAYAARNRAAGIAQGGILAFIDPDCVVFEGWGRALREAFRSGACLVALGMRRPAPDTGLNRLLGDYEVMKDRWVLTGNEPLKYFGFTNTMAVSRSAWEMHGPFDDRPRGADTIFVRRVVDAEGCAAVGFVPGMRVSHLEIDGPGTYLKKAFIYGRSLQSYRRTVASKPLTFRDRWQVFRAAAAENDYGPVRSAALAMLLLSGIAAWSLGRLAGRLRPN
jgi:glycosyltransferase involved in cell wall biosynthesis